MNQRTVAIVLVVLFAVCFVGSCSVAAVTLVGKGMGGLATLKDDLPKTKTPAKTPDDAPDTTTSPTVTDPDSDSDPADTDPDDVDPDLDGDPDDADSDAAAGAWAPPVLATAQFALFHPNKAKVDDFKTLEKLGKAAKLPVYKDEAPDEATPPYLVFRTFGTDDYEVISGDTLEQARGLNQKERDALLLAKTASVVDVILPLGKPALVHTSVKLMFDLAQASGGVLWDQEAEEYLSAAEWKARRVDAWVKDVPDVQLQYSVFVSSTDQGVTLASGGLEHFGLPELKWNRVAASSQDSAVAVMNLLAQQMVEGTVVAAPGEITVAIAKLKHPARLKAFKGDMSEGARGETDVVLTSVGTTEAPKLELSFPGSGSPTARAEAAIAAVFGSVDRVDSIDHDAELVALSKKQMDEFKKSIKPRFLKGLKPGEVLLVKAPFPTDSGGNEWMWVEVHKMKPDGSMVGILENDPDDVSDLKAGDEVNVVEDELFDWILKDKTGKRLGNATGELMQKRLGR